MKCPVCGTWTLVKETRKTSDNRKRRRYECANEHRFNTLESVIPEKTLRSQQKTAETGVGTGLPVVRVGHDGSGRAHELGRGQGPVD